MQTSSAGVGAMVLLVACKEEIMKRDWDTNLWEVKVMNLDGKLTRRCSIEWLIRNKSDEFSVSGRQRGKETKYDVNVARMFVLKILESIQVSLKSYLIVHLREVELVIKFY